jgi:PleD family two-component response regulator
VVLALATLLAVVAKSLLSIRQLRSVTESRKLQALTDELTGLGNRRHVLSVLERFFEEAELVDPGPTPCSVADRPRSLQGDQ